MNQEQLQLLHNLMSIAFAMKLDGKYNAQVDYDSSINMLAVKITDDKWPDSREGVLYHDIVKLHDNQKTTDRLFEIMLVFIDYLGALCDVESKVKLVG